MNLNQLAESANPGLWLHVGAPATLKSTILLNFAYEQAILGGKNVLLFPGEDPPFSVRQKLSAMHSTHPKFEDARLTGDLPQGYSLDLQKIKDDTLSPIERRFLNEHVDWDLDAQRNLRIGELWPYSVSAFSIYAEEINRNFPLDYICIDSVNIMRVDTLQPFGVFKGLALFASTFNQGAGVQVAAVLQIPKAIPNLPSDAISYAYDVSKYLPDEAVAMASLITSAHACSPADKTVQIRAIKTRDVPQGHILEGNLNWPSHRITFPE